MRHRTETIEDMRLIRTAIRDDGVGALRLALAAMPWLALAAGLALVLGLRSINGFPINLDHGYFFPVAWSGRAAGVLDNVWMDVVGSGVFNWHGFLQPALVAALSPGDTPSDIFLGLNLLAALTIGAAFLATRILRLGPIEATAIIVLCASVMLDARARPEVAATLATIALFTWVSRPGLPSRPAAADAAVIGFVGGLLVVTHPAIALLSAPMVALIAFARWSAPGWGHPSLLGFAAILLAIAAATIAAATIMVHGMTPALWLSGVLDHARAASGRYALGTIPHYYATSRFLPLLGLVVLCCGLGLSAYAARAIGTDRAVPARLAAGLSAALAAGLFLWLAVRDPAFYYNFSGLCVGLLLASAAGSGIARGPRTGTAFRAIAVVATGALLAGQALWLGQNLVERDAVAKTRSELAGWIASEHAAGHRICAQTAAMAAVADYAEVVRIEIMTPWSAAETEPSPAACDVFVEMQAQRNLAAPSAFPGFALVHDGFRRRSIPFLPLRPIHLGFGIHHADREIAR